MRKHHQQILSKLLFQHQTHNTHKLSAAAAAAVSLLVTSRAQTQDDDNSSSSSFLLPLLLHNNNSSSSSYYYHSCCCCHCEALPTPSANIQQFQTLSRNEIKLKYDVQWSIPLGSGSFGTVYLAIDRASQQQYALKKISKRYTNSIGFQREMNALQFIKEHGGHPNICGLREVFEDDVSRFYYCVLDLVSGGEMFDALIRMGAYSEADAARLVREVASALAYLHGIGVVHSDLKPENILLSSPRETDAVIKLVDFGSAEIIVDDDGKGCIKRRETGNTAAYAPPEALQKPRAPLKPSFDMWSLGIIMYIMLTGIHPFDTEARFSDEEVEALIKSKEPPPLRDSPYTAHLSEDAIALIEKLLDYNPDTRITAIELFDHPWVRGVTAGKEQMADSVEKLSRYRVYKSRIENKVFADFVEASDIQSDTTNKTSLIERSFRSFDKHGKGFLTTKDLGIDGDQGNDESLSLSGFSDLLSDNMKNKYFAKGKIIYNEGDIGNHMYFINSGTIEVTTKDGSIARRGQGDFFGEGALLHPMSIRSATIKCVTPVHAIEVSKEYFEKYLSSQSALKSSLREKDKIRKRNRAKLILKLQKNLIEKKYHLGDYLYKVGEDGDYLYILDEGRVDVQVDGNTVFTMKPGGLCGEHSLLTGKLRNTDAVCYSKICKLQAMPARDFYQLINTSANIKESLREICLRREVQKALVKKTKKSFPSLEDLQEVFDAADVSGNGELTLDELTTLLHFLDSNLEEEYIQEIINSLDLDENGSVSFVEFKQIFGVNEARAASI